MTIYNHRNMFLAEYWIMSPYTYWWDGSSFVQYWRFKKGKFKSHSNQAIVKPNDFSKVFRKALVAKIKSGENGTIHYTVIHRYRYRHKKPNRFMGDYKSMGFYP